MDSIILTQILTQNLAHFTNLELFLAIFPVLLLIILLGFLKMAGEKSALITLGVAVLIAIFGFHFSPKDTGLSVVYGCLKAIFPILIIILMAIFSYNVQVKTGKMEVIKEQFSSISSDKSIQVLLLTWGFGGLLEGMAGFGTAVAIPAAILISLGFKPIFSALVSLIANSVATAFGAVGTPIKALADQVEMNGHITTISADVVIQLSVLMFIVPFILVTLTDRRPAAILKNIILSVIVGAVSLITQYYSALYMGAETPAILGSIASIIVIILFGKIMTKKNEENAVKHKHSSKEIIQAWSVYGLILIFIIVINFMKNIIMEVFPLSQIQMQMDIAGAGRKVGFNFLTDAGVLLFLGSFLGGLIQGMKVGELFSLLGKTLIQIRKTIITVCCLISLSYIMDFSGMIAVLGIALASATGKLYPLFAPLIGCLGTFLTGSDTSSNILFGKLQAAVAEKIGVNKGWLASANTAGATGGKIISPQSIVVATSACDQQGKEGVILKKALPYALLYIIIAGIIVFLGAK